MCEFPSWIELEDKSIVYLTDKDLKNPCFKDNTDNDLVGHSAIRKMYTKIKGKDEEGFPCPAEIAKAIKDGKMKKLMKLGGFKKIHFNSEGQLHREDGPAVETADGSKLWSVNGKFHRTDGPACDYSNGDKAWWLNGKCHREDGPAVETADGSKHWYLNGKLHRTDGPACEYSYGDKFWYVNGERHRTDGPAAEYSNGSKIWSVNGQYHREDGPAVEYFNGEKVWYLNGKELTEKEFNKAKRKINNFDF